MFERKCEYCNNTYYKTQNRVSEHMFCGPSCAGKYRSKSSTIITFCAHCNNEVIRTSSQKKKSKSGKAFCSHSCRRKHFEDVIPKRKPEGKCKKCNTSISTRHRFCRPCAESGKYGDLTLQEAIYTKHHKSSAYALVRSRARASIPKSKCSKCPYDKHTEVCHIKPIGSFSLETKLSVINSLDNLIRLCPNCHWEYDHKLLTI